MPRSPHETVAIAKCSSGEEESGGGESGGAGAGAVCAWRAACAECAGTALLVVLSCMPACAASPLPPAHTALAAGAAVALLVQCLDHVSGAMFNPAVLLAAVVAGRVGRARAAALLPAQLAGAALAALMLRAMPRALAAPPLCLTLPAAHVSLLQAVGIEACLALCLALANCAAWDARNAGLRDSWPLRIGAAVAALSLAAGELTGASMNPARSLAPALAAWHFTHHWVYWAGPLLGALCGSLAYCALWRAPRPAPPPRAL